MTMFRDFLRHFPRARWEDYYKDFRWNMEQLEVDLALVKHHRREAGAPDPPPLEEIPQPDVPKAPMGRARPPPPRPPPGGGGGGDGSPKDKPRAPIGGRDFGGRRPKPQPPKAPPSASARAAQGPDLRELNDFVAKWKLDPVRTKTVIARLPPSRRRDIMEDFRPSLRETAGPTMSFEKFVRERVPAAVAASGAKRPPPPSTSQEPPNKRPRGEGVIGAAPAPRTPPARAPPSRPRSPIPRSGGGGGGGGARSAPAPPPWRGASGPPASARRPGGGAAPGSSSAPPGPSRGPAKAPSGGGNRPAPAPTRRPSSALTSSGAPEDAKPGDLIKSLLG